MDYKKGLKIYTTKTVKLYKPKSKDMKITGNEPAFPFWKYNEAGYGDAVVMRDRDGNMTINDYAPGLTIRQHFAALAMQGFLASYEGDTIPNHEIVARYSIKCADAMVKELNERPNPNE